MRAMVFLPAIHSRRSVSYAVSACRVSFSRSTYICSTRHSIRQHTPAYVQRLPRLLFAQHLHM
jgi:hypothetical protein